MFLRRVYLRLALSVAAPVLIGAMLVYVSSRPIRAAEGVNIGEGVLVLCLLASVALTLLALLVEGVRVLRDATARR